MEKKFLHIGGVNNQLSDVLGYLNFAVEATDRSSVYLVSDIEKYRENKDMNPYVIVELENAKKYEADAVYFRFFESGRVPLPQIYIFDTGRNTEEW